MTTLFPRSACAVVPEVSPSDARRAIDSGEPICVFFSASWCRPCTEMRRALSVFAEECGDRVRVVSVDVASAGDFARSYGVKLLPSVVLFRDGSEVTRVVGLADARALARAFSPLV